MITFENLTVEKLTGADILTQQQLNIYGESGIWDCYIAHQDVDLKYFFKGTFVDIQEGGERKTLDLSIHWRTVDLLELSELADKIFQERIKYATKRKKMMHDLEKIKEWDIADFAMNMPEDRAIDYRLADSYPNKIMALYYLQGMPYELKRVSEEIFDKQIELKIENNKDFKQEKQKKG